MTLKQNDWENIKDLYARGEITTAQANVMKVRCARVEVVANSLPREVRTAYNAAVKAGELGHMKKDGRKPEVYYHPTFEHLANAERNRIEQEQLDALSSVLVRGSDL